jgi:tRNA pseudouridine38-40 synthase
MNPTSEAAFPESDPFLRNIRLLIAYDGTDFCGWQKQKEQNSVHAREKNRTIQGEIEKALERLHKSPIRLTGSGRTDSGVHAAAQTANFYTGINNMEASRFVPALNCLLPRDIRILKAQEEKQDFHARFDARSRTYRYYIIAGRPAFPWELRYAFQIWRRPVISRLNDLAILLRGEFNCSIFAVPGDKSQSRSRYIYGASFFVEGEKIVFEITANAFLWKMVRSVVGSLLRYEEKNILPSHFREIIESGERSLAGPTVPPNGLFLWKIDYYRE